MPKFWSPDGVWGPTTNDLEEGDIRWVSVNDDNLAPYTQQIYQGGEWVDMFARLDEDGKVPSDTLALLDDDGKIPNVVLQSDVSILDGDGKLPDANLSDSVPLLDEDGKLSDDNLSASVPILDEDLLLPRGLMPQPLLPAFDRTYAIMTGDQSTTSASLQTLTELALPITATGHFGLGLSLYHFEARLIFYTVVSGVTGTAGVRLSVTGPSYVGLSYVSHYPLTTTTETVNNCSDYAQPAAANASTVAALNYATIEGFITPFASGNLRITFACNGTDAVVVKQGSHAYVELVNQSTWAPQP